MTSGDKGKPKLTERNRHSVLNAGITPRRSIAFNAKIMLATAISYPLLINYY